MNWKNTSRPWVFELPTPPVNLLLVAAWLWLYRGVFPYLAVIFTRQEFRANQIVLLGALVLVGLQVRKGAFPLRLDRPPRLYLPGLALALVSSIGYLLVEHYLDINTFAATLFGLASYGLLGSWMAPRPWRQGLPAALLLVGALPFGDHLQTFVGYPIRILTARLVRDGLNLFGLQTVGVDTILIFESGISKVDLPCSGVKSLWTGGLFLLAATWIERRRVNWRWLLLAFGFVILLLAANLLRVAVLVVVGQVAGWLLLAEMLHVPLGVLGFAGACAAAAFALRYSTAFPDPVNRDDHARREAVSRERAVADAPGAQAAVKNGWLQRFTGPLLVGCVFGLGLLYSPRPPDPVELAPQWTFPPELAAAEWPLTEEEQAWLNRSGVENAARWRFRWGELNGSLLLVTSTSWRAHHRPESCFEVYGLEADQEYSYLVAPDFPVRMLHLEDPDQSTRLSAAYWLQSAGQTTDDYATRIWSDIAPERQPWVLVTVLFDQALDPRRVEAQSLYYSLHEVVQAYLNGGGLR